MRLDAVADGAEVFGAFFEVEFVDVEDEELAVVVVFDPLLVEGVEALEVVEADAAFVFAAALLDIVPNLSVLSNV